MTVTAINNEAPAKNNRTRLIIIAIVLLVILGGGAYLLLKPKSSTPGTEASGEGANCTPATNPADGDTAKTEQMQINLSDGHYLRVTFEILFAKGAKVEGGEDGPNLAAAQDAAHSVFMNMDIADLTLPADLVKAKTKLVTALQPLYGCGVKDVYFTDFVTQ